MKTSIWGPPLWIFLHSISFNYPSTPTKQQQNQMIIFFNGLKDILPCRFCRESYSIYLSKHPIKNHVSSKKTLSKWVYNLHNCVNDKLRKQGNFIEKNPTYTNIKKKYQKNNVS